MPSNYNWFRLNETPHIMRSEPPDWEIHKKMTSQGKIYWLYRLADVGIKPVAIHLDYNALMEIADK